MTAPSSLSAWRDFRDGLHRSPTELAELQLARLQALVTFAYGNVPYYRDLFDSVGFQPRHLKHLSDVVRIPITTRERLQSAPREHLIARGYAVGKLRPSSTGGSTGRPLTVYRSQKEFRQGMFFQLRTWFHLGLPWNDHVLTISGRPSTTDKRPWVRSLPLPTRWNTNNLGAPETILESFVRLTPSVFYGHPFKMAMLASLAREREIPKGPLRVVATSGDMLLPRFREMIREHGTSIRSTSKL